MKVELLVSYMDTVHLVWPTYHIKLSTIVSYFMTCSYDIFDDFHVAVASCQPHISSYHYIICCIFPLLGPGSEFYMRADNMLTRCY